MLLRNNCVRATAMVVALILMGACGGDTISEGKVVEKIYDDADEWYQSGYYIDGGSYCSIAPPRVCTDNPDTYIPGQRHYEPERFLLKLEAPNPDDSTKTLSDERTVPESFWSKVRVGQWVDIEAMEILERRGE